MGFFCQEVHLRSYKAEANAILMGREVLPNKKIPGEGPHRSTKYGEKNTPLPRYRMNLVVVTTMTTQRTTTTISTRFAQSSSAIKRRRPPATHTHTHTRTRWKNMEGEGSSGEKEKQTNTNNSRISPPLPRSNVPACPNPSDPTAVSSSPSSTW